VQQHVLKGRDLKAVQDAAIPCYYADAPRMLVVDPVHNLFLGSAKHYMKSILVGNGILSENDFIGIQKCIDSFLVPADVGRIPYKISTGFASFTADQWKNWTKTATLHPHTACHPIP
jgi:hypothetical protein